MKYIGYSRVELLQLFQFAIEIKIVPYLFDLYIKAEYFVQKINDPPGIQSLRMQVSKLKCKYNNVTIIVTYIKVFVARYNFQAVHKDGLSFKKGQQYNTY